MRACLPVALVGSFDLGLISDASLRERLEWNLPLPGRFSRPHERAVLDVFSPHSRPWNSVSVERWQFRDFFVRNYSFSRSIFLAQKNASVSSQEEIVPLYLSRSPSVPIKRTTSHLKLLSISFSCIFFSLICRCKWKHFPVDTFVTCGFLLTRERNVVMNCERTIFSHFQPRYVVYTHPCCHILHVLVECQLPASPPPNVGFSSSFTISRVILLFVYSEH